MKALAEESFGMYSDEGADAVRHLVASVLWLALDDVNTEHVYAAVKLGLRQVEARYPEAGDSAVRDAIHDYLGEAWQLESSGWVYHYFDFPERRRFVCDWYVPAAPRDASAQLAALDLAEAERQLSVQLSELLVAPTVNAFRRLGAGTVLRGDGRPKTYLDEECASGVHLRDAGALAELSFSGRPVRLPWRQMFDLLAPLEAGCGPEYLREHALASSGA
jgi:hypothetical protein